MSAIVVNTAVADLNQITAAGPIRRLNALSRLAVRRLKPVTVGLDALAVAAANLAALAARQHLGSGIAQRDVVIDIAICLAMVPVWLAMFAHYRLYNARRLDTRLEEWRRLVHAAAASTAVMGLASYAGHLDIARAWLALCFAFA